MTREMTWLLMCGALAAGEALGFAGARFGACWPIALGALVLVALFGYGWRVRGWHVTSIFLLGLTLALAVSARRTAILDATLECSSGRAASVVAHITAPPRVRQSAAGAVYWTIPARVGSVKIRAVWTPPSDAVRPREGERWLFTGWLAREPLQNRDTRMFWMRGAKTGARKLPTTRFEQLTRAMHDFRRTLLQRAGIGLEHDAQGAALTRAILLGARADLSSAVRTDFAAAGTIHLFAISGLHVMFIAHLVRLFLILIGLPLRVTDGLTIPLLWCYAWLTGFAPSAVRATTMATFFLSATVFSRRSNLLLAWAQTFLLVHIFSPLMLFDIGCRLSFLVMLAIAWWLRFGPQGLSEAKNNIGLLLVIWAAGVPLTARIFERFTLGGLVANPLLIPVAEWSVTAGALGLATSFVSEGLAAVLNNFAALATQIMAGVSALVAKLPGASTEIAPWTPGMCAGWYLALILTIWLLRQRTGATRFLCRGEVILMTCSFVESLMPRI